MMLKRVLSLRARLTLRYLLALGAVAALTLASSGLVEHAVGTEVVSAKLLNVAGRQRMLCQRVDILAERALHSQGAERQARLDEMETVAAELTAGHEQLIHGPPEALGLGPGNKALALLREGGQEHEVLLHAFAERARGYGRVLAVSEQAGKDEVRLLGQAGDQLLAQLDARMAALQGLGDQTLTRLRQLILGLSAATLAALALTGFFLFRPMVAEVVRDRLHLEDLNRNLESLAETDKLTGLANRRSWDASIPKEFAKASRLGQTLCLIMADLDHFKRVNDEYGHLRGDEVLREFAKRLRQTVRESDSVFRLGGEEFALLLPGTDIDKGMTVAEKLRELVELKALSGLRVTASFGVAVTDGNETPDELVNRADQALYAAKTGGRNRVSARERDA